MMAVTSVIHVLLQKTNVPETFSKRSWMFPNEIVLVLFLQWSILVKERKVQSFSRFEQFYRYTLTFQAERPEIGLRSQASHVKNIKKNLGREYASASLNRLKMRFPSSHRSWSCTSLYPSNADDKMTLKWNTVGHITESSFINGITSLKNAL